MITFGGSKDNHFCHGYNEILAFRPECKTQDLLKLCWFCFSEIDKFWYAKYELAIYWIHTEFSNFTKVLTSICVYQSLYKLIP